jgi:hypothetical protein
METSGYLKYAFKNGLSFPLVLSGLPAFVVLSKQAGNPERGLHQLWATFMLASGLPTKTFGSDKHF